MTVTLETIDENSLAIVSKFSQGLAANELKARNNALKIVRAWLINKSIRGEKLDKYV